MDLSFWLGGIAHFFRPGSGSEEMLRGRETLIIYDSEQARFLQCAPAVSHL